MQTPPPSHTKGEAIPEVARHASWLYWVAALSLANIVLILIGANVGFAISLGLTDFLAAMGNEAGGGFKAVTMAVSLAVIAFMGVLGYFACRGAVWALVVGLVVLVLDTVLLFLAGVDAIISIAIHVWAIISLGMGLKAALSLGQGQPVAPNTIEIGQRPPDDKGPL